MPAMMSRLSKYATQETLDAPVEAVFANIAHAYLQSQSPALMPYEIGFQLIDKDDDDDRAAGVMSFKVGKEWLYSPLVFRKGQLRGHEILILKNQNLFVPNVEKWVNYIINRKPVELGKTVDRYQSIRTAQRPDLLRLLQPIGKYASTMSKHAVEALPYIGRAVTRFPDFDFCPDGELMLPKLVKLAGLGVLKTLAEWADEYPQLAVALDNVYGDSLEKAAAEVVAIEKQAMAKQARELVAETRRSRNLLDGFVPTPRHPVRDGRLAVFTKSALSERDPQVAVLTDAEKLTLDREGLLVIDKRAEDEISTAYAEDGPLHLYSVKEPGVYDVLVNHADFKRCAVLTPMAGKAGNYDRVLVVPVEGEGDRKHLLTHPSKVFYSQERPAAEWKSWFEGLSSTEPSESENYGKRYVAVMPNGRATLPFTVEQELEASDDCKPLRVRFERGEGHFGTQTYEPVKDADPTAFNVGDNQGDGPCCYGQSVVTMHILKRKGVKFRTAVDEIFLPPEAKFIVLSNDAKSPIELGNLPDLKLSLRKEAQTLTIYHNGLEVDVNGARMSPTAAIASLIARHGLTKHAAATMLKEADTANRRYGQKKKFLVKYAQPFQQTPFLQTGGPSAPAFPQPTTYEEQVFNTTVRAQPAQDMHVPIPEMSRGQNNWKVEPPDPQAMQAAQQAVSTGQKEIVDASIVTSLLRTNDIDKKFTEFLGPLTKAMDVLGQLLLLYHWHPDKVEETYGKADMGELEDSLQNNFAHIGDLVLFLRQKTVDPDSDLSLDLE